MGYLDSDLVSFNEIIGLDLIRHLDSLQLVPCLHGWAISMPDGLVPFGEVDSFLSADRSPLSEVSHLSFNIVLGHLISRDVSFVLNYEPI